MLRALHFRGRTQLKARFALRHCTWLDGAGLGAAGWMLGFLSLFPAAALPGQNLPMQNSTGGPASSDACPKVGEAGARSGTLLGAVACGAGPVLASHRDVLLGLAGWDHTLLGAFKLGARLLHLSSADLVPVRVSRPAQPVSVTGRFTTNGGRITINQLAQAWKIDQLQRSGMNMDMKSPYGTFRLTYREIFNGRSTNALGGGVGQASAAAMFTTPRFGSGGLWDFSAAALLGNGSINQLMSGGFGNNNIGGFGPHLRKSEGPTVAVKLTF